jgi:hypothetical protein
MVSGPAGPGTDGIARALRASLERGCTLPKGVKTAPRDWTFSSRSTVEFADGHFFTLRVTTESDCGGTIADADSRLVTYAAATGTRLGFADFFTEALTLDRLVAWAEAHEPGFEKPFGDCRATVAGTRTLDAALVAGGVLVSPVLPNIDEDCDFEVKMPFEALSPYVRKSGPLASYRQRPR